MELQRYLHGRYGVLIHVYALDRIGFSDNVDCGGFGNRDRMAVDYKWRDPYTGEVVCNP